MLLSFESKVEKKFWGALQKKNDGFIENEVTVAAIFD